MYLVIHAGIKGFIEFGTTKVIWSENGHTVYVKHRYEDALWNGMILGIFARYLFAPSWSWNQLPQLLTYRLYIQQFW